MLLANANIYIYNYMYTNMSEVLYYINLISNKATENDTE